MPYLCHNSFAQVGRYFSDGYVPQQGNELFKPIGGLVCYIFPTQQAKHYVY